MWFNFKGTNMTKLLKKTAIVAGIASMCFAGVAGATVLHPVGNDFGTLMAPDTQAFDGIEAASGATVFDSIRFAMGNTAQGDFATIASAIGGWGWASFTTSLWTTVDLSGTMLAQGSAVSDGNGAWHSIYQFSPLTVAGSPYFIHINAVTLQTSTEARYSGNLTLAPLAPIPEPDTYAMMVAGLGLMGFVARRRKGAKSAT
jgi:hypothetical protein